MNKNLVIANIALISDAAEYFDRKIGSAWKLRATITNALVWAANRLVTLTGNNEASQDLIDNAKTQLATLRIWAKDIDSSGLTLDLLHGSVRRTLGLERKIEPHDEACRVARDKCQRARSAARFKEFYDAARTALDEQHRRREEAVEEIVNLLSDSGFGDATDADLYDENAVEVQFDRICDALANVLEAMHVQCDAELSAAIVTSKIQRLEGYMTSIEQMMDIVGVDKSKLAKRQVALEAAMKAAEAAIFATVKSIDEDIEGEITKMMIEQEEAKVEPKPKAKRKHVPATEAERFNALIKRKSVAELRIMLEHAESQDKAEAISDELNSRGITQ